MASAPLITSLLVACGLSASLASCGSGSGETGGDGGAGGNPASTSTSAGGATTSSAGPGGSGGVGGTGGAGASGAAGSVTASSSSGAPCDPGAVEDCYTGPANTENVGVCHGGQHTCMPNGTFGPCMGEVKPQAEVCATPEDDNCNGMVNEGGIDCACVPNATTSCYSGPPNTQGQGICKEGMQTCDSMGLTLGPCVGEVVPVAEDCVSPADEDCDGTAQACTGNQLFAKRYGDAMAQQGRAIAAHAGGAVLTGALAGTADFGGGALTSAGNNDIFVASIDYLGTHIWSKRFGDAAAQTGVALAVDVLGNTVVIGDFAGSVDFGRGALTSAGNTDVFLVKLDKDGNLIWSKKFGDAAAQNARGVALDDQGNILITGSFAGTVNFGGGNLTSAGGADAFVAKLDADGAHVWSKKWGDGVAQVGAAVAADGMGNVFVAGDLAGNANFGGGNLLSAGGTDVFIVELDPAGNHVWSKIFGNVSSQNVQGLAVDSVGNVIVTGNVAGNINFGGGALTSAGGTDVFLAKLTAGGVHLWSKIFGAAGADNSRGVAVDPTGAVVLTGDFPGTINFGGGALTSAGGTDVFVAKFDSFGAHVWSHRYGDAQAQAPSGISADATGVFVTGGFAGVINFGGGNLTSAGGTDIFAAKLAP